MEKINLNLKILMVMKKIKMSEIARGIGVSRQAVSLFVNNKMTSGRIREAIAKALEISEDEVEKLRGS